MIALAGGNTGRADLHAQPPPPHTVCDTVIEDGHVVREQVHNRDIYCIYMYMDKTAVAVHEVCPQRGKSADNQGGTGEAVAAAAASLAIVILAEAG